MQLRHLSPEDGAGVRLLEGARAELDAAWTLVRNLRDGELPACDHLLRAAGLLTLVHKGNVPGGGQDEGGQLETGSVDARAFPGLTEEQRKELVSRLEVVRQGSRTVGAAEGVDRRQVRRSVRIVHDLLEQVLVASRRSARRAGPFSRVRRANPRWWVAGAAVLLVGAIVVLFGHHLPTPGRPAVAHHGAVTRPGKPVVVSLADLSRPKAAGTPWDAPGTVRIPKGSAGLVVRLPARSHARSIEVSLDNNDRYRIDFLMGRSSMAHFLLGPKLDQPGLVVYRSEVPRAAATRGFDAIRIVPLQGDGAYSVGHLVLEAATKGNSGRARGSHGADAPR